MPTIFHLRRGLLLLLGSMAAPLIPFTASGEESPYPESQISRGPWGAVEYYEVIVEPPTTHLWSTLFEEKSEWQLGPTTQTEAEAAFVELGFSSKLRELLGTTATWKKIPSGLAVEFGDDVVEVMTSVERAALAEWLETKNDDFFSRILINLEGRSTDLLEGRVRPETKTLVDSIAFYRGTVLSILDRPWLLRQLGDDHEEKVKVLKALFGTRGVIGRLIIDDTSDLDTLIDYWGAGRRSPRVGSVLRSIKATEGLDRVDLIHLLPPVPRKYSFTYVNLRDVNPVNSPDCYWASLNFFHTTASHRLLDTLDLNHYLAHDYTEISEPPRFGDMVCLFDETSNEFVHSYIHIIDEIAYTKNGASFARPFLLNLNTRMMSVYQADRKFTKRVFRINQTN